MASASHSTHLVKTAVADTVTVYYRWHPLFGQTLNVYKRRRGRTGERKVCELGDGRTIAIPAWMLHPDCAQMLLGPPQISLEALAELRRLLSDFAQQHVR